MVNFFHLKTYLNKPDFNEHRTRGRVASGEELEGERVEREGLGGGGLLKKRNPAETSFLEAIVEDYKQRGAGWQSARLVVTANPEQALCRRRGRGAGRLW